jgi:hypothetical protein
MDTAKRRKYGGNLIVLVELDSNNTIPGTITSGTNAIALSCQEESDSPLETSEEILRTEDGLVADVDQEHNAKTTATLLENDAAKANFLAYTVRGKKFLEIKYNGIAAGNHEEMFSIVRFKPGRSIKTPKGKMPYESTHIPPNAAVTFSAANITAIETALSISIRAAGPVTIPAGQEDFTATTTVS